MLRQFVEVPSFREDLLQEPLHARLPYRLHIDRWIIFYAEKLEARFQIDRNGGSYLPAKGRLTRGRLLQELAQLRCQLRELPLIPTRKAANIGLNVLRPAGEGKPCEMDYIVLLFFISSTEVCVPLGFHSFNYISLWTILQVQIHK